MMSNREAIALLRNLEDALDSYCELNEEGKTAFRMAIESLELFGNSEHLPSAQPKIIRCKDCEYYHPYYCEKWSKFGTMQTAEDGYCYKAERREE